MATNWLYLEGPKKVTSFKQPNSNPNSVLEFTKDNFVSFLPHFLETKSVVIFGKSEKGYFFQATKLEPENQSFIRYRSRVSVLEFTKDNFISFHSHFWETKWSCLEGLKKVISFKQPNSNPKIKGLLDIDHAATKFQEHQQIPLLPSPLNLVSNWFVYCAHYCVFLLTHVKIIVQFERCFRLMEHISVISCRNPINLYITEKLIKLTKSLFNFYLVVQINNENKRLVFRPLCSLSGVPSRTRCV